MTKRRRNTRTNCTATPNGMNISTDTTVVIACNRKKDKNHVQQQKIQLQVVYYTNNPRIVHDSVGQEKGVSKQVSSKR